MALSLMVLALPTLLALLLLLTLLTLLALLTLLRLLLLLVLLALLTSELAQPRKRALQHRWFAMIALCTCCSDCGAVVHCHWHILPFLQLSVESAHCIKKGWAQMDPDECQGACNHIRSSLVSTELPMTNLPGKCALQHRWLPMTKQRLHPGERALKHRWCPLITMSTPLVKCDDETQQKA